MKSIYVRCTFTVHVYEFGLIGECRKYFMNVSVNLGIISNLLFKEHMKSLKSNRRIYFTDIFKHNNILRNNNYFHEMKKSQEKNVS